MKRAPRKKPARARAAPRPKKSSNKQKQHIKISIKNSSTSSSGGGGGGGQPIYIPSGYAPAPAAAPAQSEFMPEQFIQRVLPTFIKEIDDRLQRRDKPAPVLHVPDAPAPAPPAVPMANPSLEPKLRRAIENKAFTLKEVNQKVGAAPEPAMPEDEPEIVTKPPKPRVVHDLEDFDLVPPQMQLVPIKKEPSVHVPEMLRKPRVQSFLKRAREPEPEVRFTQIVPVGEPALSRAKPPAVVKAGRPSAFSRVREMMRDQQARKLRQFSDAQKRAAVVVPAKQPGKQQPPMIADAPPSKPAEQAVVPYEDPALPLFGIGIKRKNSKIAKEYLSKIALNSKKPSRPNLEAKRRKTAAP